MCLAIPGIVNRIEGRQVWVKYPNVINKAMLAEEEIRVGDWVMVQMGLVVRKLDEKQASEMMKAWEEV